MHVTIIIGLMHGTITIGFNMLSSACSNVFKLLAQRELSPQTKRAPKRLWGKTSSHCDKSSGLKSELAKDARQELRSW